jgi:hypothetical protein
MVGKFGMIQNRKKSEIPGYPKLKDYLRVVGYAYAKTIDDSLEYDKKIKLLEKFLYRMQLLYIFLKRNDKCLLVKNDMTA